MSTYKKNIKSGIKNMHMVNQNTSNTIKHIHKYAETKM